MQQKTTNPDEWPRHLVTLMRNFVKKNRATALLLGAGPTSDEVAAIVDMTGIDRETLIGVPLYTQAESLMAQNLRFLRAQLPKGQAEKAAREIGITPSQLSRWGSGIDRPRRSNVRKLLKFHGIDQDIDLTDVPLFLTMDSISGHAKKQWAAMRLQEMPASRWRKFFRRSSGC
ncbi:MAG: helix-turn-helix transcriptional regulator [Verrucomicrobiales bacterium]